MHALPSMRPARTARQAGRPRSIARLATVMCLAASVVALAISPASAGADAGNGGKKQIPHPKRDYMGSTIPANTDQEKGPPPTGREIREASTMASTPGIDVSHWQGEINWDAVAADGIEFAYIKATEGTSYTDPEFDDNYVSSYYAGLIRGAYHFALPDVSSGAAQARFFVENGGNWSSDGQTLPPVLDIEYNPYGGDCYGLSDWQMVNWIADFSNTVKSMSGRYPVIYTTTDWWTRCTGDYTGFSDTNPLWIAKWDSDPYPLPSGWSYYTIWQYTAEGQVNGISGNVDRDSFNGSYDRLQAFATCTSENPC